jgi:hypothetical protein
VTTQPPPPEPPQGKPEPFFIRHPMAVVAVGIGVALAVLVLANLLIGRNGTERQPTNQEGATVQVIATPESLCWSGAFGNRTVDGCGSDVVDMPAGGVGGIHSATAQKQGGDAGTLELVLRINDTEVDRASTEAAYGVVSVVGQE